MRTNFCTRKDELWRTSEVDCEENDLLLGDGGEDSRRVDRGGVVVAVAAVGSGVVVVLVRE